MNKTICPFPWMHLSSATTGDARLCCNVTEKGSIVKDNGSSVKLKDIHNIDDFFNLNFFRDIRKKMIAGEKVDFCQRCYDLEDNGAESVRTDALKYYDIEKLIQNTDVHTGKISNVAVKSLDLSWSNYCNLQCKMCDPGSSNQLEKEWEYFKQPYKQKINLDDWSFDTLKPLLADVSTSIEEILVTGGEPLLNKNFLQYIDYLIEKDLAKNILIRFHTNLTIFPTKFIDRFAKFKKIHIHLSIDGVEKTYEYIRHPAKWKIVEKNIQNLLNLIQNYDHFYVEIHTVFQSYNLHNIVDLVKYFDQYRNVKYFQSFPYFIYCYGPKFAVPNLVPLSYRNIYREEILNYLESYDGDKTNHLYRTLQSCCNLLDFKENNFNSFIHDILSKDKYRKQNAYEVLPWLKKYARPRPN